METVGEKIRHWLEGQMNVYGWINGWINGWMMAGCVDG